MNFEVLKNIPILEQYGSKIRHFVFFHKTVLQNQNMKRIISYILNFELSKSDLFGH